MVDMVGMPEKRDFWIGLWLIPFGIITTTVVYALMAGIKYGWENLQTGRVPIILAMSIAFLFVYFVLAGWGARQATGRVIPGVPICSVELRFLMIRIFRRVDDLNLQPARLWV